MNNKKEKILIYSAMAIIIILILVVIVMIWFPMFNKISNSDINTYNSTITYEDTMKEYYSNYLNEYLKITNFDILYEKINKDYMSDIGIQNKDEMKQYLRDNDLISMDIDVQNIEYSNNENYSIFRVLYNSHGIKKYVNIKETEPYKFSITFEQSELNTLLEKNDINLTLNNVNYIFELIESTENSIRYKLTIENNSNNEYIYDFSALNSIQLVYSNSNYVNMASVANSSTVNYSLTPGSTKSIEILFNISFNNQFNINGFLLNNVKVDGANTKIELLF